MSFKTLVAFAICGILAMAVGIHALHGLEASFAANAAAVDAAVAQAKHPGAAKKQLQQQQKEPKFFPIDQLEQWRATHHDQH